MESVTQQNAALGEEAGAASESMQDQSGQLKQLIMSSSSKGRQQRTVILGRSRTFALAALIWEVAITPYRHGQDDLVSLLEIFEGVWC